MGLERPVEVSVTSLLKLYFPPMYEIIRRAGRYTAAIDSVPTTTLERLWKNSARGSFARRGVASSAAGGSRMWLKYVMA